MSFWWVNYDPNHDPIKPVLANGGTIEDFTTWNLSSTGIYGYQETNITIDGFVCLGDPNELANGQSDTFGMQFQDYFVGGLTVQNCDIQNEACGIQTPADCPAPVLIKDCYFACATGVLDDALWCVDESGNGIPARMVTVDNCTFAAPASGGTWNAIYMSWFLPFQLQDPGINLIQQDQLFVTNYQGVSGQNFQVFYTQQAADFIVPQTTYNADGTLAALGCPVAGLTNAQAWAQYGIAVAGEVAPSDATTMDNIVGLVAPV